MSAYIKETGCSCGKEHHSLLNKLLLAPGATKETAQCVRDLGGKTAFLIADKNTFAAAGDKVTASLNTGGIPYGSYIFPQDRVKPDEAAVGAAVMHLDGNADVLIGIGSGVINDICKLTAKIAHKPYIIVATAPSVDGYASATSSVDLDGLKVSLPSGCANVVIGDVDILKNAPEKMLTAGLGDMLAKYVSLCEWRISHLINGEYYCPAVADLVRKALKKCVSNAAGLLRREEAAICAVFEGLVLCGEAMNYAGCSRPASGVEHYFSHAWDMRALEFGTPWDLHGIQCAIGTYYATRIYAHLQTVTPNRDKARSYAAAFDFDAHAAELRKFFGKGAKTMIDAEAADGKYDLAKHEKRLDALLTHWQDILTIINEELPTPETLSEIMDLIHAPKSLTEIGLPKDILPMTFLSTKDIRDKYVLSRICWDLGILDDIIRNCL